jgi:hypothetical protein
MKNIILIIGLLFSLSGCYFKTATYQMFEIKRNHYVLSNNNQLIPQQYSKLRKIYSEDKYIYIFRGDNPECVYGYLTNRDDKPERVVDWIIISGKEYCEETPGVGTWM